MNRCLSCFQSWPLLHHQIFSMYIMQNDCLLPACIANPTLVQAASTPSKHIQAARPTSTLFWDIVPLMTLCCPVLAMTLKCLCLDANSTKSCYCISKLACMQVNMLEEVVRQLSHDLKLAEAQQKASSSSSSSRVEEDVVQSTKGSPATQREMQALSARVCSNGVLTRIL